MKYEVEVTDRFKKEFRKLDKYTQKMIRYWIDKNLVDCENPRINGKVNGKVNGKAIVGDKREKWRYRIGDYRLITIIDDGKLMILAISVGHRREIYK